MKILDNIVTISFDADDMKFLYELTVFAVNCHTDHYINGNHQDTLSEGAVDLATLLRDLSNRC